MILGIVEEGIIVVIDKMNIATIRFAISTICEVGTSYEKRFAKVVEKCAKNLAHPSPRDNCESVKVKRPTQRNDWIYALMYYSVASL